MMSTLFISYSHAENKAHEWVERLKGFLDGGAGDVASQCLVRQGHRTR